MNSVIEIKPLTRVEGHGLVRVYWDGQQVDRVELALIEPPRLFEALLIGKHFQEIPDIICRICSLCSTIHRVTALMAVEQALGISVSDTTKGYRQLTVLGGHIQSHALHLFCLALPDYLNAASFVDLARHAPDLLTLGLKIKAVGNDIQETVGGRLIHPVNIKIGGMGKLLERQDLLRLKKELQSILSGTLSTVELFASFATPEPATLTTTFLAINPTSSYPFFGNTLVTSNGESIPDSDYRASLGEETNDHSHGKVSKFKGKTVTVGALARLNLGLPLTTLANDRFESAKDKLATGGIWTNNLAQAIELVLSVETAIETIDMLLKGKQKQQKPQTGARQGRGTAITEAPRGVLIHSYSFDSRGYCNQADIVTPTAINQLAMEEDLLAVARTMKDADEVDIKLKLEMLVRAYDPCISCAVHMIKL